MIISTMVSNQGSSTRNYRNNLGITIYTNAYDNSNPTVNANLQREREEMLA